MTMTTHRIDGLHGIVEVTSRDLDDLKAGFEGQLRHPSSRSSRERIGAPQVEA